MQEDADKESEFPLFLRLELQHVTSHAMALEYVQHGERMDLEELTYEDLTLERVKATGVCEGSALNIE
eukprot:3055138-Amphidinium_carterae.1